jgi:NAD-dependent deacetylase
MMHRGGEMGSGSEEALETAAGWLRNAERVVAFTGAGVSAESGIPTFRDAGGVWDEFDPAVFGTTSGLMQVAATRPAELARFMLGVIEPIAKAEPNAGHRALTRLASVVITQNVDGLHQEAGSETVWEIHGSLLKIVGANGAHVRTLTRDDLVEMAAQLHASMQGVLKLPRVLSAISPMLGLGAGLVHRPNVVMFGESLVEPDFTRSSEASARCDAMLLVGTSGEVWPANQLPVEAERNGAKLIGVGPEEIEADVWLLGNAGDVLPRLLDKVEGGAT